MTSVAGVNEAKRRFFQCQDVYVKYHPVVNNKSKVLNNRNNSCTSLPTSKCTIFSSAYSPTYENKRYVVACTSDGYIIVWGDQQHGLDRSEGPLKPILSIPVCGGKISGSESNVLYDLQFIQTNGEHLLVVSGVPGILIYKWSNFERAIAAVIDGGEDEQPKPKKPKCQDPQPPRVPTDEITPITTFKPHTSPTASFGGSVEFNSTSYSKTDDILYGAAGDVFGCYQWDLATETLLGTFGGGGSSRYNGSGHRDYLHVVKAIPEAEGMGSRYVMTGGEDGNMGMWDAKSRKLIEMMNIQSTMDKNKDLVSSSTATSSNRGFLSTSSTSWSNSGPNSWVSSMDTNGDWLAVCGGTENTIGLTSRSGPNTSGFMTLWHLPTRTFTSGCVTRESINTVVHNHCLGCFVSGGNEGRVSFWDGVSAVRSGRSWCTSPAIYTISVDPDSSSMVVGGAGGLDRFVDRVKVSKLLTSS